MKHFLSTGNFSSLELEAFVARASAFKSKAADSKPLAGRSVALVFLDPSMRTRTSMQVAIYELGGSAVVLEPGSNAWTLEHVDGAVMDAGKTEHIKDFVRVLSRYVSAIGIRTFAALEDWQLERTDPILKAFAAYSEVPVINLESSMYHPCQSLADMMTIRENFGTEKKKVLLTWAWHPKALPMAVPNSFALAAAQFGHDLTISHPTGYDLDEELITHIGSIAAEAGGSLTISNDAFRGFDGAELVYAKSWGSKDFYGSMEQELAARSEFRSDWIVDAAKMGRTAEAAFMHCLPVRRNVIVTDEVIDSPWSLIIDEAENRLHMQKAILEYVIGD